MVTERPETSLTAVMQARVASPSTWTVQAPHSATPQPILCSGEPQFVPQIPEQRHRRIAVEGLLLAVDAQLDHGVPPGLVPIARFYLRRSGPGNIVNPERLFAAVPTIGTLGGFRGCSSGWRRPANNLRSATDLSRYEAPKPDLVARCMRVNPSRERASST